MWIMIYAARIVELTEWNSPYLAEIWITCLSMFLAFYTFLHILSLFMCKDVLVLSMCVLPGLLLEWGEYNVNKSRDIFHKKNVSCSVLILSIVYSWNQKCTKYKKTTCFLCCFSSSGFFHSERRFSPWWERICFTLDNDAPSPWWKPVSCLTFCFVQRVWTLDYWENIPFWRCELLNFTQSLMFACDICNVPVWRYETGNFLRCKQPSCTVKKE